MIFFACILGACAVNLLTSRWGTGLSDTAVLTFQRHGGGGEVTGLFPASWLGGAQWLSTLTGVLVPMFMIGIGVYFVARGENSTTHP